MLYIYHYCAEIESDDQIGQQVITRKYKMDGILEMFVPIITIELYREAKKLISANVPAFKDKAFTVTSFTFLHEVPDASPPEVG